MIPDRESKSGAGVGSGLKSRSLEGAFPVRGGCL